MNQSSSIDHLDSQRYHPQVWSILNVKWVSVAYFCLLWVMFCSLFNYTYSYTPTKRYWVFFKDKGDSKEDHITADPKALERRVRAQGAIFDYYDLPVFKQYIDKVVKLGAKVHVTSRWLNAVTVECSPGVLNKISQLEFVSKVEDVLSYKFRGVRTSVPITDRSSTLGLRSPVSYYGMSFEQVAQTGADFLHDLGYHGEGITIALLDTGFDLSHIALSNVKVKAQYDFINNDDVVSDEPPVDDIGQDDHGTQVLSIIAGYKPGELIGVAYGAEFLLAKTEKVSENGMTFEQRIEEDWWVAGLEWAEQHGADIVSSSLGYTDWYEYKDINGMTARTTIAANIAVEKGVIVVVSAGNEGKSINWPYISVPADGFDVVAVGATDRNGNLAEFSSIGPTYDGRIKPDLVAMGQDNVVVDPNNRFGYRKASGTSMATPIIAGGIALLKQALPFINDPRTIIKLLKYTASRALNPDNFYGWGIANFKHAYNFASFPGSMKELSNWDPLSSISAHNQIMIYPNPASLRLSKGRINFRSSRSIKSLEIYNLLGEVVYRRTDLDNAHFLSWDLRTNNGQMISSGIYICVIRDSSGIVTIKKIAIIN